VSALLQSRSQNCLSNNLALQTYRFIKGVAIEPKLVTTRLCLIQRSQCRQPSQLSDWWLFN